MARNETSTNDTDMHLQMRSESNASVDIDDVHSKYTVMAAASAVLFVGVGYSNTFGVFQEYYQTNLLQNERPEKIIVIGSIASSLYLVLGIFTGRLADLIGYRFCLLLGTACMTGAMFAASCSTTYIELLLCQGILFGLGVAFAYLPAVSISRQYWNQRHGIANGIVVSGGALGGCILPYLVRLMIEHLGLQQTFRILGYVAAGILLPSTILLKPKTPSNSSWIRRQSHARPPLLDLSLLHDQRFLILVVACTVAMFGFLPRFFLIPPSAVAQGIGNVYASWLLGMLNGLSIIGRIGIGWFADRYGKVTALSLSFTLCGVGHILFWLPAVKVSNEDAATALFTLFVVYTGLFGSGFISLFPVVVSHLFGSESLASKNGLLNSVLGVATLAGPSAVYAVIGDGMTKNWWQGVIVAGVFMFAGGMLLGLLQVAPHSKLLHHWIRPFTDRPVPS